MLAETGFELKKVTADFTDRPPSTESERLFFTAGKPKPSFKRNDGFKMHFAIGAIKLFMAYSVTREIASSLTIYLHRICHVYAERHD